jgi:predicted ATPase/DNA-binding XRE family transcriptional regulator
LSTATLAAAGAFGDLLRHLRRRSGMTQGELAARVGFSIAQISRLEQNQRLPDLAVIAESFVPALDLQGEPRLVQRLLELAAAARGKRPPVAIRLTRTVQASIHEQMVEDAATLPSAPTALVGRARSLRALCQRLMEMPGRLMTLVGPPGVGKTRLAVAAAAQLQDLFADGAHFIPLAALADPELVAATIIAGLGLAQNSPKPAALRLVEVLRRREMLLVLDNFEQVTPAAPMVAQLLEQCAGLRLLVTSREPLRLRAEQRFKLSLLEPAAAAELFLQRAQAIQPDFAPGAEDAATIVELCLRLDCLPLAIELVAARSELFTPSQLLEQLKHGRLALLEAGARDLPDRHRTLRAAIAWSYRLLTPTAQQQLRCLGVFWGGFEPDAARAVAENWNSQTSSLTPVDFTGDLQSLVASNLVVQHETENGRRYSMLETIREFALEQAELHQELDRLNGCHARYFLAWTETQVQWSFDHAEGVWWRQLEQEHENLRAALRWLLRADGEQALRLAITLQPFWETRGYQHEGSRWLQQALALNPAPTALRAQGLVKAGIFAQLRMEFEPAAALLAEALTLFRALSDQAGIAETLRAWGWLAASMSDAAHARLCFEESLALFRNLNQRVMVATVLSNLVHLLSYSDAPYEQIRAYAEESLSIFREVGQQHGIALALRQLGINETRVGSYAAAAAAFTEALAIWQRRGAGREIAWTLEMLGEAYWLLGDVTVAANHWTETLSLFENMDEEFGMMVLCHHLGQVERSRGNLAAATDGYRRAIHYFEKLDSPHFVARCLAGLGGVALAHGQAETAAQLLAAAYRLFDALPPFLAPADQADYGRLVDSVRAALGEEDFRIAWETGRNLSTEQAIQLGKRKDIVV